jgi:hypothetical protein
MERTCNLVPVWVILNSVFYLLFWQNFRIIPIHSMKCSVLMINYMGSSVTGSRSYAVGCMASPQMDFLKNFVQNFHMWGQPGRKTGLC